MAGSIAFASLFDAVYLGWSIFTHNFEDVIKLWYTRVVDRVQSCLVVIRNLQLDEPRQVVRHAERRYAIEHLGSVQIEFNLACLTKIIVCRSFSRLFVSNLIFLGER